MPTVNLTDLFVKKTKPTDRQVDYYDAKIKSFGLRVSPGGTKSYFLWYRYLDQAKRLKLGRANAVSLAEARKKAHQALAVIADGRDPAPPKCHAERVGKDAPFDAYVETFIEKHAKRHNKSWKETERILKKEFGTKWKTCAIGSIKKSELNAVIDAIIDRGSPGTANLAFSSIRKLFNWAVERGDLAVSPAAKLKNPVKLQSRDRVLSLSEVAAVWVAADHMGYPYGNVVQLLILTAQRRSEVAGMRWQDLDLSTGLWTISALKNKSGRQHVVPLLPTAWSLLSSIPKTKFTGLFAGRGTDNPISGWAKWKRELDALSGVSNWRLHDLRRTAATEMAKANVPPHVIERVLNHSSGILGGVAGVYNRYGYLDEIRNALEAWEITLTDELSGVSQRRRVA